jgi:hypothetical protein
VQAFSNNKNFQSSFLFFVSLWSFISLIQDVRSLKILLLLLFCTNCCLLDQLRIRKNIFILSVLMSPMIFLCLLGFTFCLYHFLSSGRTSFNISCKAGLLTINFLKFSLSDKVFISQLLNRNLLYMEF